jgi:hypothetical protein
MIVPFLDDGGVEPCVLLTKPGRRRGCNGAQPASSQPKISRKSCTFCVARSPRFKILKMLTYWRPAAALANRTGTPAARYSLLSAMLAGEIALQWSPELHVPLGLFVARC